MGEIARLFPDAGVEPGPVPADADPALAEALRIAEALLFAAPEPLTEQDIEKRLPCGVSVASVLGTLKADYASRGVNLVRAGGRWMFRTATDLAWLLAGGEGEQKRLSRAALETLAIVAYHQPVTRAEIEDIRGVAISKGTLDVLLETGWIRIRGRRRAPGRPITYGTTQSFLIHFGLDSITDLPGVEELKGAGLFDGRLPSGFSIPQPSDGEALAADEDPLEGEQDRHVADSGDAGSDIAGAEVGNLAPAGTAATAAEDGDCA